ncbi:MAG TPA: hypothetical protein VKM94_01965 [Blastocatellia bacterium]|nr:hypothetical protein [Blastocatellia bacterium]
MNLGREEGREDMNLGREDKLRQLERVLQSRAMHGSENLKSFLKFVALKSIDDATDQVKEYTIATEVFGRRNDFSPRSDSVVRVQASRLRQKLQEYYASEGRSDRILIELPKGHYYPVFSVVEGTRGAQPATEPTEAGNGGGQPQISTLPPKEVSASSRRNTRRGVAFATAIVVLLAAIVVLLISNINLRSRSRDAESRSDAEKFGPVWVPFLKNDDQTLLVLSNPAVYRFTNARDTDAILKNSLNLTPEEAKHVSETVGDKFMVKHNGGRLVLSTDEFTGMGEAIGLARTTSLFREANRGVLLKQSRTISPEDLKNYNIILLGSVWVNEWSGKLPIKEDFTYTSRATIENLNPLNGEEREYGPKFDNDGRLVEDYGLITIKPNILYRNTVMVLAGIHSEGTEAAAEYVTNPDYLKTLTDRLLQLSGSQTPPRYYQALLKVAVDHGMPTTISLISVHELKAQSN